MLRNLINGVISLIVGVIFTFICFLLLKSQNGYFVIPFLVCGIIIIIKGILNILNFINIYSNRNIDKIGNYEKYQKINKIITKIFLTSFFLFWFISLLIIDFTAFKYWESWGSPIFYFSILFWIVGIYVLYKNKKK